MRVGRVTGSTLNDAAGVSLSLPEEDERGGVRRGGRGGGGIQKEAILLTRIISDYVVEGAHFMPLTG